MCAAAGADWFSDVSSAAGAMSDAISSATEPCADRRARYTGLLEIYREVYPRLRDTYQQLASFQDSGAATAREPSIP